jgi:hypothetical protein
VGLTWPLGVENRTILSAYELVRVFVGVFQVAYDRSHVAIHEIGDRVDDGLFFLGQGDLLAPEPAKPSVQ